MGPLIGVLVGALIDALLGRLTPTMRRVVEFVSFQARPSLLGFGFVL